MRQRERPTFNHRLHRRYPLWLKKLLNWYYKKHGDPGDRR